MREFIRLSFRIVVLGSDAANHQDLISRIKTLISPIAIFYDFNISPYPKIPESQMLRIDFDVSAPFENGIDRVVAQVGGTGWHISKDKHEQGAIWASSDSLVHPFGRCIHWCEIQLIPHEQLAIPENR